MIKQKILWSLYGIILATLTSSYASAGSIDCTATSQVHLLQRLVYTEGDTNVQIASKYSGGELSSFTITSTVNNFGAQKHFFDGNVPGVLSSFVVEGGKAIVLWELDRKTHDLDADELAQADKEGANVQFLNCTTNP